MGVSYVRSVVNVNAHRGVPAHRYLWALPIYTSVVNVDAHRGMPVHRYLWAFPMYASVANVDAHKGMPVHPYLCAFPMYASVVNVDVHRSPPPNFVNARRRQPLIGNSLARRFLITVDGSFKNTNATNCKHLAGVARAQT